MQSKTQCRRNWGKQAGRLDEMVLEHARRVELRQVPVLQVIDEDAALREETLVNTETPVRDDLEEVISHDEPAEVGEDHDCRDQDERECPVPVQCRQPVALARDDGHLYHADQGRQQYPVLLRQHRQQGKDTDGRTHYDVCLLLADRQQRASVEVQCQAGEHECRRELRHALHDIERGRHQEWMQ